MNITLTDSERDRLQTLADRADDATMRGTKTADRPRVMLYRVIEAGLRALEQPK